MTGDRPVRDTAMPPVVALDAMGVLYRHGNQVTGLLVPYLRDKGCRETPDTIRSTYHACTRGDIDTRTLWTVLGMAEVANDIEYCQRHLLTPGLVPALEALTAAGVRLACLTNDTAEWSAILRRRFHLDRYIDHWCVSAEIGVRKPDLRAYGRLLDTLGVAAPDVLFVDDRGPNLTAARQTGMQTILYTSEDTDNHPVPADLVRVHTMAELTASVVTGRHGSGQGGRDDTS